MNKDIYLGPGPFNEEPKKPIGQYTAADQARGFGVPEEQLVGEPTTTNLPGIKEGSDQ